MDWFRSQNWTAPFVPTAVDTARIESAPVGAIIAGRGAAANTVAVISNSLEVTTGGTLDLSGSLSIGPGGTFTAHNGATVSVGNVPTSVRVEDGATAIIDNATLTAVGDVEVGRSSTSAGSLLAVVNGAVVNVASGIGTVFVGGSADATLAIGQGGTAGTVNAATVDLGSAGSKVVFQHTGTTTFAAAITNLGQVEVIGPGTTILTGANTYAGGTTIAAGTLQIGDGGTTGSLGTGAVTNDGTLAFNRSDTLIVANAVSGSGAVTQIGPGTTVLTGTNTYTGSTTIAAGTLQIGNGGTTGSIVGNIVNSGVFAINRSDAYEFAGDISGTGAFAQTGPGITTLTGSSTYSGATEVLAGTLQAGAVNAFGNLSATTVAGGATLDLNGFSQTLGSLAGAGNVMLGTAALTAGGNNATTTFAGVIADTGGLTKAGLGTLTLTGTNTYTGATTVTAGGLIVNGSIAASSLTTVNAGAVLGGTGTVGNTTINGGALSPGNSIGTIAVQGNLTFSTAAAYLVEVSASNADRTNIAGTANLAGTVNAWFAAGGNLVHTYTILSAAGGLGGTTFGGLTTVNLPASFVASLNYTDTDVILNLAAVLGTTSGLNRNQQNVANAVDAFFNSGGTLPLGFGALFGLAGGNLASALSAMSGEAATGAQQGAFQLTGQ
ncbi:MAG: autotransporter-associated beta strand repeat-containing protein, partial [Acetobacteraceae bacterium]|nr:autotransporter-associated beta strand repeat-containing protein [Acetobacteraceae bacterium]